MVYSSFERSVNARKQLRGKDGRWIYEGGSVKWFDALKGIMRSGIVSGFDGQNVNITSNDGGESVRVPRTQIESIAKKASLGGLKKADFDALPKGSLVTTKEDQPALWQKQNGDDWKRIDSQSPVTISGEELSKKPGAQISVDGDEEGLSVGEKVTSQNYTNVAPGSTLTDSKGQKFVVDGDGNAWQLGSDSNRQSEENFKSTLDSDEFTVSEVTSESGDDSETKANIGPEFVDPGLGPDVSDYDKAVAMWEAEGKIGPGPDPAKFDEKGNFKTLKKSPVPSPNIYPENEMLPHKPTAAPEGWVPSGELKPIDVVDGEITDSTGAKTGILAESDFGKYLIDSTTKGTPFGMDLKQSMGWFKEHFGKPMDAGEKPNWLDLKSESYTPRSGDIVFLKPTSGPWNAKKEKYVLLQNTEGGWIASPILSKGDAKVKSVHSGFFTDEEFSKRLSSVVRPVDKSQANVEEVAPETESIDTDRNESGMLSFDPSTWKKFKDNTIGYNDGGFYTSPSGQEYYVKRPPSNEAAQSEYLADQLYQAAGATTLDLELIDLGDGKIGLASKIQKLDESLKDVVQKKDQDSLAKVHEDFAADAWLANWDAVGTGDTPYSNIAFDEQGRAVRVDPGGSLDYKGTGTKKPSSAFGDDVVEFESMAGKSGHTNHYTTSVFGSMTDEQRAESAKKVAAVTDDTIDELVEAQGWDEARTEKVKATLKARRDDIIKRAGIEKSAPESQEDAAPEAEEIAPEPEVEAPATPTDKSSMIAHLEQVGTDEYIAHVSKNHDAIKPGFWGTRKGQVGDVYTPHTDQDTYKILLQELPSKHGDFWEVMDQNGNISKTTISHANQSLWRPNAPIESEESSTDAPETPEVSDNVFSVLPKDQRGKSGDGYHESGPWGKFGASGVMIHAEDTDKFFIVQRGGYVTTNVGKWHIPGGAREENETVYQGAAREITEETSFGEDQIAQLQHVGDVVFDNGKGWSYTNIAANLPNEADITVDPAEINDGKWVSADELRKMRDNGELVPAFGDNLDNILAKFDSKNESEVETVEVPEEEAEEIPLQPVSNVQGIGGKSTGTGIPTSDNGQGIVSHDHSEVSLSGVPKGKTTKDPMDIQSAGIGQKLYDPESDLEFERLDVDTWEDSTGVKYTVPEMSSLAKADGFIWGSKEDFMGQAPKLLSDDEPAPTGKVPDNDKEYEWSEVDQLVGEFYSNSVPGTNDDIVNYKLADGTRIMLSNTGEPDADGIEILPSGMPPKADNWLGPISWEDAKKSNDVSKDIQNLISGSSTPGAAPEAAPRLSQDAADLNSLPEGSVVKFGDASDSKVYLKNADGTWSASWLDDNHPQKNVTSDQIHAVAAYLGKDVQVMKEDGKPNPQAEPELADWEKELLAGYPVADFEPGDFFYIDDDISYTKEADGLWTAHDKASGDEITMSEQEVVALLNNEKHTPQKNVVPSGAKAPAPENTPNYEGALSEELLEAYGLDVDDEIADFLDKAPIGSKVTFQEIAEGKTFVPNTLVKISNDTWKDEGNGEEWEENLLNSTYSPANLLNFEEGNNAPSPAPTPSPNEHPSKTYGITEPNFAQKLDEFPVGTSITIDDGSGDSTYYKDSDGKWAPDNGGSAIPSSDLANYYYVNDITAISPGAAPESEEENVLSKYGITENNLAQKYAEFPVDTAVTYKLNANGSYHTYVKNSDGTWGDPNDSGILTAQELEDKFYAYEIDAIDVPDQSAPVEPQTAPASTPDVAKTVDGINIDSDGNQWVADKNGQPIQKGTIVVSKAGEKGKVDLIQKGGAKVRVKTEDGNTKFWNVHLVEAQPEGTVFDDSNNKYAVQTDENGKEYLNSPDGDRIYVGDTVVSSGKAGIEGEVVGFKNGEFVLVRDPSDNKVKPRKIDKIKLVSSAQPTPSATPEAEPQVPEAAPSALQHGDNLNTLTHEEFDALPVGFQIELDDPKMVYTKADDGKWYATLADGNKVSSFNNTVWGVAQTGALTAYKSDESTAPGKSLSSGDDVSTKEEFDALEPGTVLSVPVFSDPSKLFLYEKLPSGKFKKILDPMSGETSDPYEYPADAFDTSIGKTLKVHSLPGESTAPAPTSTAQLKTSGKVTSPDEIKNAPLDSRVQVDVEGHTDSMTKIGDNKWHADGYEDTYVYTDEQISNLLSGPGLKWIPQPGEEAGTSAPTPEPEPSFTMYDAGTIVDSVDDLKNAPSGSVIHMTNPNLPAGNTLGMFYKHSDGDWYGIPESQKTNQSGVSSDQLALAVKNKVLAWDKDSPNTNSASNSSEPLSPPTTMEEFKALPDGTKIKSDPTSDYFYVKNGPNSWEAFKISDGQSLGMQPFNDAAFEFPIKSGGVQFYEPKASTPTQPTPAAAVESLPGKNGKNIAVGATVSHPVKGGKGKVVSVDTANGNATFIDENGKKRTYKAKFLNVDKEAGDTTPDALPKDPTSPWYEKEEPTAPTAPSDLRSDFALDGLLEEISENYKQQKGKDFTSSSYAPQFDQLSKNGSSDITIYPNTVKYGNQSDVFDFFRVRGLISQETADKAKAHFAQVKAENDAKNQSFTESMEKYKEDLSAWKQANGIPGSEFNALTFKPSASAKEILALTNASGHGPGTTYGDKVMPTLSDVGSTKKDKAMFDIWVGGGDYTDYTDPSNSIPYVSWSDFSQDLRTKGEAGHLNPGLLKPDHAKVKKAITEAIMKSSALEDMLFARSGEPKNFVGPNGETFSTSTDLKSMVGSVITDYGVIAGSPGHKPGYDQNSMHIKIRVPKGAPIAWLGGKNDINKGEYEALIPPGSRFLVHDVLPSQSGSWGKPVLVLDMVPEDWKPAAGQTTGAINKPGGGPSTAGPTTSPAPTPPASTAPDPGVGPGVWV